MVDELKCFVCQSADGSSSEKRRRKISETHKNLDSSSWKIFCHYFYPPPLVSLLDSSASKNSGDKYQNEDFSRIPVFCGVCYQTISNLCNLHSQLELIQRQISKIVAQVSLDFVQEDRQVQKRKKEQEENQQCDENVIYSMRRVIRQRYQPSVCISRANLDIIIQIGSGGSRCKNNLEVDSPQFSPLSTHSNASNQALDVDEDFARKIKPEAEDSFDETIDNKEHVEDHKRIIKNKNPDPQVQKSPNEKALRKTRKKRKIEQKRKNSSEEEEDGSDGNQNQESSSDSDYEPNSEDNFGALSKPKSQVKMEKKTASRKRSARGSYKVNKDAVNPTKDPKVGENMYEYGGKWRYEKKRDESGSIRFYCMSCPKIYVKRWSLTQHIKRRHKDDLIRQGQRTRKIDDNNFIYDKIYSIQKVTEPNGIFFKCGTCGARKKSIGHVKVHLKEVHIDPAKYVCHVCGFSCPSQFRLSLHMESHDQFGKYVCDVCGIVLKSKRTLKSHRDSHGPGFACECSQKFVTQKALRAHRVKASHFGSNVDPTPENPFSPKTCDLCKKEFMTEEYFQKHVAVCQGRVKTPCDGCGEMFLWPEMHKQRNRCKGRINKQNLKQNDTKALDGVE